MSTNKKFFYYTFFAILLLIINFAGCINSSTSTEFSSSTWNDDGVEPAAPNWDATSPYYVRKVAENYFEVLLKWMPVTTNAYGNPKNNIVGYKVYRQKQGEERKLIATVMDTTYVDRDPNLEEGAVYYYFVTAFDSMSRESSPSGVQTIRIEVPKKEIPAMPTNLVMLPTNDGRGFIVSWDKPTTNEDGSALSDLNKFVIERRQGPTGDYERIAEVPADKLIYVDHSLTPGNAYYYRIRAVDIDGNFSVGLEGGNNLLGREDDINPASPTSLSVVPGDGINTLSWVEPTLNADGTNLVDGDLIGYKIYRKKIFDTGDFTLIKVIYRGTSWKDTTVEPNQDYIYTISAVDSSGNESVLATPVATQTGYQIPAAPAGITARFTEDEFLLMWSEVTNVPVSSYKLYRSLLPDGPYQYVMTVTADEDGSSTNGSWGKRLSRPALTDPIYYWKVSAVSSQGIEGPLSPYVKVTPNPGYTIIEGENIVHSVIGNSTSGNSIVVYAQTFPYPWNNLSTLTASFAANNDSINYYLELQGNRTYTFDFYFVSMPDSGTFELNIDGGGATTVNAVLDMYSNDIPKVIRKSYSVEVGPALGDTRQVSIKITSGAPEKIYLDKIVINQM